MSTVAVVAHREGTLGGGLDELRRLLKEEDVDPVWHEASDFRRIGPLARQSLQEGADLIFAWGGDGTVQQCIDALAGREAVLAILPAGTGNLLARNLAIPTDLPEAVRIGLHGTRRLLDTGLVNGEHFGLMAGAGLDAIMMKEADSETKSVIGPAAYLVSGARNLGASTVGASISLDGRPFFRGDISLVLVANVGQTLAGIEVFREAQPDDGLLELGVVTATNIIEWLRTLGRLAAGTPEQSPFTEMARGQRMEVHFDRPFLYEVDGSPRRAARRLRIAVQPGSIRVCVPPASGRRRSREDDGG